MPEYAGIHLLDTPFCIDKAYDYYIPPNLRRDLQCGDFVTVPFGTANNSKIGLVTAIKDQPENNKIEHKAILGICEDELSMSEEALGLCIFLKEQTLCTVGEAAKAVTPISLLSKAQTVYRVTDIQGADGLSGKTLEVYEYIASHKQCTPTLLKSRFECGLDVYLKRLTDAGLIRKEFSITGISEKYTDCYTLTVPRERAVAIADGADTVRLRSQKHAEILRVLAEADGELEGKELARLCGATKAQLTSLCSRGLIELRKKTVDRGLGLIAYEKTDTPIILNEEQTAAYSRLCQLCDEAEAHGVLLHGVTGSGKTSVMMRTIDHVLECGKGVIVLLPEIALTPQTLRIFCSRYGERVAIIHSALSGGEKADTYRRIKSGDANIVIGTRSAVFAPVKDLGLIIIDEEQEHTYKSDMNPKYHTRDVARYRAAYNKAVMLLASATPSFESYKKALDGAYTLIELKTRYGIAQLPQAIIEDMRPEIGAGNISPLGSALCKRLIEVKSEGNQSILFLNRRGYNNFLSCRDCGEAIKCPSCSVSMTYHINSGRDDGYLACHWCGKRIPVPSVCPSCNGTHIARMGYGTQRVEEELKSLLPDAEILRMDTDTTSEKSSYERLLGKFRRHEADILLGTQMVTKGHDFPDVTLVGVLLADSSLYLDDYRAAERTFAMLTQVIGRAGRADKPGVAIIQTNNPDNECIRLACKQDYPAFYQSEIRLRKLLVFPPFCDIALLTLTSGDEKELMRASSLLTEKLRELIESKYNDLPLIVFGPFEAPVYKVENKYRMRTVIKCRNNKRTRAMLAEVLGYFSGSGAHGLSLSVDINPTNL